MSAVKTAALHTSSFNLHVFLFHPSALPKRVTTLAAIPGSISGGPRLGTISGAATTLVVRARPTRSSKSTCRYCQPALDAGGAERGRAKLGEDRSAEQAPMCILNDNRRLSASRQGYAADAAELCSPLTGCGAGSMAVMQFDAEKMRGLVEERNGLTLAADPHIRERAFLGETFWCGEGKEVQA